MRRRELLKIFSVVPFIGAIGAALTRCAQQGRVLLEAEATVDNESDALSATQRHYRVGTSQYREGTMVTSLNGFAPNSEEGWIYLVRREGQEEMPNHEARRTRVRPGDVLKWQLVVGT